MNFAATAHAKPMKTFYQTFLSAHCCTHASYTSLAARTMHTARWEEWHREKERYRRGTHCAEGKHSGELTKEENDDNK